MRRLAKMASGALFRDWVTRLGWRSTSLNTNTMTYNFAPDLQAARLKAALTQADCAHLLGVTYTRISKLESGQRQPSTTEFAILCLIYNEDVAVMQKKIIGAEAKTLGDRLSSMPKCPKTWLNRRGRIITLNGIAARLSAFNRWP